MGSFYCGRVLNIARSNLISYWPLWESSGAIAYDLSDYKRNVPYTNVALGVNGIGDGCSAATFDGTTSLIDIYSAGLNSAFNGQEGTISLWIKASGIAIWSDANFQRFIKITVDSNNNIDLLRDATQPGYVYIVHKAGGTIKAAYHNVLGGLEWFNMTVTWSKTADQLKLYIDGVQQGATITGLGTWVGNLSSTACVIGAQSTTLDASLWNGGLAHVAIWNKPLTATQVASIGILPTWAQSYSGWGTTPDWQDDFPGTNLNSAYWTAINNGMMAYEAYLLQNNISVSGSKMIVTTQVETKGGKTKTSGFVHTLGKVHFTYGRFEISAKLPKSQGYWPGIWFLPIQNYFFEVWSPEGGYYGAWPISGEIDLVEVIGQHANRNYPGMHAGNPHLSSPTPYYEIPSGDFADGQHLFVLEWLPHAMKFYIDGVLVREHNTWFTSGGNFPAPYDQPFFLMINTLLGGTLPDWPGPTDGTTVYPGILEVEYVKYYKYNIDVQLLTPATAYWEKVMATSPIAYWPLWEPAELNAYDRTANALTAYYNANVTLKATGIGDGRYAASFNGTNSVINLYSAALNAAFNGAAGSLMFWAKVSGASVWTGANFLRIVQIRVDDNNKVDVIRWGGENNALIAEYKAGGTTKAVYPYVGPTTAWFNVILTWSKVADQFKVYINGVQSGTTQTGLGTWAGNLDNWTTVIGAGDATPYGDVWSGSIAHVALWNTVLTPTQIAAITTV